MSFLSDPGTYEACPDCEHTTPYRQKRKRPPKLPCTIRWVTTVNPDTEPVCPRCRAQIAASRLRVLARNLTRVAQITGQEFKL